MCTVQCTVISLCRGQAVTTGLSQVTLDTAEPPPPSNIMGRGARLVQAILFKGILRTDNIFWWWCLHCQCDPVRPAVSWVSGARPGRYTEILTGVTLSNSQAQAALLATVHWSIVNTNSEYQWSVWCQWVSVPVIMMNWCQFCVQYLAWSGAVLLIDLMIAMVCRTWL